MMLAGAATMTLILLLALPAASAGLEPPGKSARRYPNRPGGGGQLSVA